MSMWLLLPIAILIVVLWAGWYITAFVIDRRRSADVANDRERLDVDPQGPTSIPRERQDPDGRDERGPGV